MIKPLKNLSLIVATDKNLGIGLNGKMPWHLKDDLKEFKNITSRNVVVMGRKTFDSIGKPLPNRENIVLTSNKNFIKEGIKTFNNVNSFLESIYQEKQYFIIGGGEIYKTLYKYCNKLYHTKIDAELEVDTFFPSEVFNLKWDKKRSKTYFKNEKNDFDFEIVEYEIKS